MPTHSIDIGHHILELWYSNWNGLERVSHHGKVLSEKRSFAYPASRHVFEVDTGAGGEEIEVRVAGPLGYVVRKDGVVVAEKDRAFLRYFALLFALVGMFFLARWTKTAIRGGGERRKAAVPV